MTKNLKKKAYPLKHFRNFYASEKNWRIGVTYILHRYTHVKVLCLERFGINGLFFYLIGMYYNGCFLRQTCSIQVTLLVSFSYGNRMGQDYDLGVARQQVICTS